MLVSSATEINSANELIKTKKSILDSAVEINTGGTVTSGTFITVLLTSAIEVNSANNLIPTKFLKLSSASEINLANSFHKAPYKKYYGEFTVFLQPEYPINLKQSI